MNVSTKKCFSTVVLMILIFLLNNTFYAQEVSEEYPLPIGGMESIMKNVKYPEAAKKEGIEGKVLVKAVINTEGKVIKTEIVQSVSPELDKAAQDGILKTKFTPAVKDGKKIQAEVTIPVKFKLCEENKNKE